MRTALVAALLLVCACAAPAPRSDSRAMFPTIQKGQELAKGLSGIATDSTYGYTTSNPVQVGGGPSNERAYLGMLTGPNGEMLQFARLGSFGGFDVLVDGYECSYEGADSSVVIYIDMYTYNDPKAPVGFRIRPEFDGRTEEP